jgi:hypothetical protein
MRFVLPHAFMAFLWACLMLISASFSLWQSNGFLTSHLSSILILVFFSALIAYPLAIVTLHILDRHKRFETQLAGSFLFLTIATSGVTAIVYSLNYWNFFHQWHSAPFSRLWAWQFFYTNLGALYQFAVMGLGLFMPLGIIFLCLISVYIAQTNMKKRSY